MTRLGKTFKRAKTPEAAQVALASELPVGLEADKARGWLNSNGIPFSDDGNTLNFTLDGPRRGLMVSVRWIFHVHVDGGHVTGADVEEGLIGP
jgi:hypothetical protein